MVGGGGGEEFWIKNHVNRGVGWELVGRVRGMNKWETQLVDRWKFLNERSPYIDGSIRGPTEANPVSL